MHRNKIGIARRFGRAVTLHIGLIAIAVILGIFAANWIIEERMVKQALTAESDHFWAALKTNGSFALPDTSNLKGYLSIKTDNQLLPQELRGLPLGFHKLKSSSDYRVALVSELGSEQLTLVFNAGQVRQLAILFGLVPLGFLLFVIYGSVFASYRLFRSSVSPVVMLAKKVQQLGPETLNSEDFNVDDLDDNVDQEIVSLTHALNQLVLRVENFVERERDFTRNVSHELRTPLTVINMACDLILQEPDITDSSEKTVRRIKNAASNMVNLVETFLLISREMDDDLKINAISIRMLIESELEFIQPLIENKSIEISIKNDNDFSIKANEKVLSGLIGNLLRNAATYTDEGQISIEIGEQTLTISDTGIGMSQSEIDQVFDAHYRGNHTKRIGHGIGMTIVKKLTDRFGWDINIQSVYGQGTVVSITFNT